MGETIVVDMTKPFNRKLYRLAQLKMCLSIQAKTGLRHSRGSVIKEYNKEYGTSFRTAKSAFEDAQRRMDELTAPIVEDPA